VEKKLEQDLEKYVLRLEKADKEKKEIIAAARQEARQLLEGVNKKIENTIRQIRESQAEKERRFRPGKSCRSSKIRWRDTAGPPGDAGGKLVAAQGQAGKAAGKDRKKMRPSAGKKTSREPADKGVLKKAIM
jgi:DNA mismatch repair protein MutS2